MQRNIYKNKHVAMKKSNHIPEVKSFFDKEEKNLYKSIERGEWKPVRNQKKEMARAHAAARYTLAKSKSISIRLTSVDLERIKSKAIQEGLPYQTLIGSIIHKYAHKE